MNQKKIVTLLFKYDYGKKERGESLEKRAFLPAIENFSSNVSKFWLEENGYPDDLDRLQTQIIKFCEDNEPDLIFTILMVDEISNGTLDYLKSKYKTVNWFADDDWRFDNYTKEKAKHFSFAITTDPFSIDKYYENGLLNVYLSSWGSFYVPTKEAFEIESNYKYSVSFVGSISPFRKWVISNLNKRGIKVDCFGSGWDNGRVTYEEMFEIFKKSKINLNISNSVSNDIRFVLSNYKNCIYWIKEKKRFEQIKARQFEIASTGVFQLTNYVPGLELYFDIGSNIVVYTNIDDLEKILKYYLKNEDLRKKIEIQSSNNKSKYTYNEIIESLFNKIL